MIRYIGSIYTEAIRFETINFLYMCVYRFESVHIATHSPYKVFFFSIKLTIVRTFLKKPLAFLVSYQVKRQRDFKRSIMVLASAAHILKGLSCYESFP